MSSLVLTGSTSGTVTLEASAIAGGTTVTFAPTSGTLGPLVSATAVTASGTSVDFTGIPSWVKRITVMFSGVSTNGTSSYQIQIGSSSGVENTGYTGQSGIAQNASASSVLAYTTGFGIASGSAANLATGVFYICNTSSNTWVFAGNYTLNTATPTFGGSAGSKTLSGTLDRLRIIASATGNPADTFDAGTINIMYE